MAAIFKLRRGSTASPSLVDGELFLNYTTGTLQFASASVVSNLLPLGKSITGNIILNGNISATNLTLTGDILANDISARNVRLSGNIFLGDNDNTTDIIEVNASFSGSLLPKETDIYSLGSAQYRYKELHVISASIENVSLPGTGILSSSLQDFDTYSSSIELQLDSIYTFTQSADSRLSDLEFFSSSEYITDSSSFDSRLDVIETTFSTSVDLRLDNAESTGSDHESRINFIESYSSSLDLRLDNLEWTGSDQESRLDVIETTFSTSVDLRLDNLEITGSDHETRIIQLEDFSASLDDDFLNTNGDNVVSSSEQISNYNVFLEIDGMGVVSGSSQIDVNSTQNFQTFSSSVDTRLDSLENFSSSEYIADSSSFDSRLDTLEGSFSTSVDLRLDNAEATGSDHETRITSIEGYSASLDSRLDDLEATGSDHESRLDEIETTFSSSVDLRLDNAEWTGSDQESRLDVIETTFSSSVDSRLDLLENFSSSEYIADSASFDQRVDYLEASQSYFDDTFSGSVDSRLDELEGPFSSSVNQQLTSIHSYTSSLKNAIDVNGLNLTVLGNLTVQGTQTSLNTTEVVVEDILLALASGSTTSVQADGGGIFISGANASMTWNHTDQLMEFNTKVSSSVGFKGDGSELENIPHEGIVFDGSGIVSGSSQIDLTQTTNYVSGILARVNAIGLFSQSAQVNADSITNFDQNVKDKINLDLVHSGSFLGTATTSNLDEGTNLYYTNQRVQDVINSNGLISGSPQLEGVFLEINGDNVVSGSSQIDVNQTQNFQTFSSSVDLRLDNVESQNQSDSDRLGALELFSESLDLQYLNTNGDDVVSGSSQIDLTQTTNYVSGIKDRLDAENVFSGSDQLTSSFDDRYLQINGDDVVSGSSQVDLTQTGNYISGIKTRLNLESVVSGSSQIDVNNTQNFIIFSSSVDTRLDTLEGSFSTSVDLRLDDVESTGSDHESRLDVIETTFSSSVDSRLDSVELTSHTHSNKVNLDKINQDLSTTDKATFENIYLPNLSLLPTASEFSVLLYSQSGEIAYSELGTAAYYHVSQSISNGDEDVIGTAAAMKDYIDEQLLIIGAGDITEIIAGDGLSGGAESGPATLTLNTSSLHFQSGVVSSLPLGIISGSTFNNFSQSVDLRLDNAEAANASGNDRLNDLELWSSSLDDDYVTQGELESATGSLINSIATKLDTGSYNTDSSSFDLRIDNLESFSSSLDKEDPLTFSDTATIDFTRNLNTITANVIGGVVSGSQQVKSLLPIGTVSGSSQLTGSFDTRYLNTVGDSVFSGSSQVQFNGITGNLFASASGYVAIDSGVQFVIPLGGTSLGFNQTGFRMIDLHLSNEINFLGQTKISRNPATGNIIFRNSVGSALSAEIDFDTIFNKPTLVSGSSQISFNDVSSNPFESNPNGITASNHIVPASDNTYDLGSADLRWRTLYVGANTIDLGGTLISRDEATGNVQFIDSSSLTPLSADVDFDTLINKPTLVSGSSQIDVEQTTNYDQVVNISGSQTIVGTKTFNDIVVNGTGSFAYITSVAGDAKIIGDAFVVVNNNTPTSRYAGLSVYDSGSTLSTASFYFDGQTNDWGYEYSSSAGVDYAVSIFGPEYSTKGNPTYLTSNRIPKAVDNHHLNDSNISDSGTLITLGSNVEVNGNIAVTGTVDGVDVALLKSNFDTLKGKTLVSQSAQISAYNVFLEKNGDNVVSGSSQISLSGDVTGTATSNTVGKIQGIAITSGEATQISNIGSTTISSTQWGYLGGLDQGLSTLSQVQFGKVGIGGAADVTYELKVTGDIGATGDVVAFISSDRRLKDEITPIENSLQKINSIGGYSFVWNENQHIYKGKDYGVIAQEIEEILPELVETRENGYKAVKYDRIVSLLIEGIKELSKEVSELKKQIGK